MILLAVLWAIPLALLGWRAAVSGDPWRIRIAALGVIFAALFGAVLLSAIPQGDYSRAFGLAVQLVSILFAVIGSVYLLYWAGVTHDPPPHRLASVLGGTVGLVPALFAIAFALTHTAEPAQ